MEDKNTLSYGHIVKFQINGKYGFKDELDNIIISPKYDYIGEFKCGIAKYRIKGLYGYINDEGLEITPNKYYYAENFQEGFALVASEEEEQMEPDYYPDTFTPFVQCSFVDINGKVTEINKAWEYISCSIINITSFHNGVALIALGEAGKYIDTHFQPLFSFCANNLNKPQTNSYEAKEFHEGLAAIKNKRTGKWGFINKKGKLVTALLYDSVKPYQEGFASVLSNGYWGVINKNGEKVVDHLYENISSFVNNIALVSFKGGSDKTYMGVINTKGELITPLKYQKIKPFYNQYTYVQINNKWGMIDDLGNEIIPPEYDGILELNNGIILKNNNQSVLISRLGQKQCLSYNIIDYGIGPYYENGFFNEGLARIQQNEKWGFINKNGDLVINAEFDTAYKFCNERALVKMESKWGFIDKQGRIAITLKYEAAHSFQEDLAGVKLNGKWGFIDKTGKTIIPFVFNHLEESFNEGIAFMQDAEGDYVSIDKEGNILKACKILEALKEKYRLRFADYG